MKRVSKGCSVLGLMLLIIVIIGCAPLTIPRIFGYQIYEVISGSMEPSIPTGSIVYVRQVEPTEIKEEEIIVFFGKHDKDTVVTHRVIENDINNREYITKGDANKERDMEAVSYSHLIGKVEYSIPFIGIMMPMISSVTGKLYLIGMIIAAFLLRIIGDRLKNSQ